MRRCLVVGFTALLTVAGCTQDEDGGSADTTVDESVPDSSSESVPTSDDPATTEVPVTDPPPVDPPPTQPAVTDPPVTDPPATSPPTDPPATDPPAKDPPSTDAATPVFNSFEVTGVGECPAPDVPAASLPREVTVSWDVADATSIYVAIDNVDGPFEQDLDPVGTIKLSNNCPDGNTYYVVAENAAGRTVMESTKP